MSERWDAPPQYENRCGGLTDPDAQNFCGLVLMLEDSIADLTCAIEQNGWANDTVTILVSDNGGNSRGKIAHDTRERGTFTAHCF